MKWLKGVLVFLRIWDFYKRIFWPGCVAGLIVLIIYFTVKYINNRASKPPPAPRTIGIMEPTGEKGTPQMSIVLEYRRLSLITENDDFSENSPEIRTL